ncbi:MAG: RecB-family nuclease [Desulfurococcales archaeon]|nr:RecB-family nuclease [Desulfurococcales archaeon]
MPLQGVVLNNTASANRVIETIKIARAYGISTVYFTRVYGAAAQSGIPEAFKYAMKHGIAIAVFPELSDLVEIVKGELYLLTPTGEPIESESKTDFYLVIDGSDSGFEPLEARLGKKVSITDLPKGLPATAMLAVALHNLTRGKKTG